MQAPETELIISCEGQELLRRTVGPGEYTLGRSEACDLYIPSDTVSRKHAKLTINYSNLFLEDLGSFNGTAVNGGLLVGRTQIWHGQQILLGSVSLKLSKICAALEPGESLAPAQSLVIETLPEDVVFQHGGYQVGQLLGRGGMGAVLQAEDSSIQRQVAMKVVLRGDSTVDVLRFIHEARITGQLEHPNIIPVHMLGADEHGQPFYTMKLVRGTTLHHALRELGYGEEKAVEQYPLSALLTIFQKVCDAIRFAHSQKIIHRDIKPDNIMLGNFGEVLVMDWGLAKRLASPEESADAPPTPADASSLADGIDYRADAKTISGSIVGTPQYMPPEQAEGKVELLDERADIYSLGAILYHILTLQSPVRADSNEHALQKVIRGDIMTPHEAVQDISKHTLDAKKTKVWPMLKQDGDAGVLPHLPAGKIPASLEAVVLKAMSHEREDRYPTVEDLQKDITAYQNGYATTAEHAGVAKLLYLLIKRNRTLSTAIGLAVLLVGAFSAELLRESNRSSQATLLLEKAALKFFEKAQEELDANKPEQALKAVDSALEITPSKAEYKQLKEEALKRLEHR
ncbi:MAG: FHA domain-containing protein, partial [Verrucomicrobia bacterium]|nr:FHA domain-containing protein [Verrucomicrobiota bacterium]